ncbi:MAG TPA: lytic transglycosylase domain-containing protein, partial [Patescibacteria group bacterium]|nr:lytic transglycosylase domain-containing protein [Patescibacteria group bacterium]
TLVLLLAEILLSQTNIAFADQVEVRQYTGGEQSIRELLCAPTQTNGNTPENANSNDLYNCINKLYRVAIVVASIGGMIMIIAAGYVYMSAGGNQESVNKAKSMISSTIAALVILFVGYLLLKLINPNIVTFQPIQPESVRSASSTSLNLCQPSNPGCSKGNTCSAYDSAIKTAAAKVSIGSLNAEALIRSIMYNESSCGANLSSVAGSYGIMQLQPSTANQYKSSCGVSNAIDQAWLTNPNNFAASICIGAYYLQHLSQSGCGSDVRSIAAGYNGGEAACQNSVDCASDTSCAGGSVKKWECAYDDPQHSTPNTGYQETRSYAPKVLGCYNANL